MAQKSDFLFDHKASHFFLPWICGLMVFIATLIVAGGISVHNSLNLWQKGIAESLTIQIPTYNPDGSPRNEAVYQDIETTMMITRTTPGVQGAVVLDDEQMQQLMTPWLGPDAVVSQLPLPKLIDVSVDSRNPPSLEQLKQDLNAQVPTAVLDSHRIWLSELINFSNALLHLIGFILILLFATTVITVVYTTKTALTIQEYALSLVHMLGAKDWYIMHKYAWHHFKSAFGGSMIGFILALPIILGITLFLRAVSGQIFQSSLTTSQWILLLFIPLSTALLAFLTTFHTVWKFLRKFL